MIATTATKVIGRSVAIVTVTAMDPETVTGIENDASGAESAGGTKTETRRWKAPRASVEVLMGAIGAERGAEAGTMIGDTLDVTVTVKMAIEARAATFTEAGLLVDHALSHQLTTDTTGQVQMDVPVVTK
jgi:hypothetical protein